MRTLSLAVLAASLLAACGGADQPPPLQDTFVTSTAGAMRALQPGKPRAGVAVVAGLRNDFRVHLFEGGLRVVGAGGLGAVEEHAGAARVMFADDAIAYDLDGAAGKAYRVYQAAFDRVPDRAGLTYWIEAMDRGMALEDVAAQFASSHEFAALFGTGADNGAFVRKLYANVLHREPEAEGVSYWVGTLDRGNVSRAAVLAAFSESDENRVRVAPAIANGIPYDLEGVYLAAGSGASPGYANGPGALARFKSPSGLALDAAGNLYVGDPFNSAIRKVTPAGMVSTVAGQPRYPGMQVAPESVDFLSSPEEIAFDGANNMYFIEGGTVARITTAGVKQLLYRPANGASTALAVAPDGTLYVGGGTVIMRVVQPGTVSTLAGSTASGSADGAGAAASFMKIDSLALAPDGTLYAADSTAFTIRKITPDGKVTTVAGAFRQAGNKDGKGPDARFREPRGIAVDSQGRVYISDKGNHNIRAILPAGDVITLAGEGTPGNIDNVVQYARFNEPDGIAVDRNGDIYVADRGNTTIRKISAQIVRTFAGAGLGEPGRDGVGTAARFHHDYLGIAMAADGIAYIADGSWIRTLARDGTVGTWAGSATRHITDGPRGQAQFFGMSDIAIGRAGTMYVTDAGTIRSISAAGAVETLVGNEVYSPRHVLEFGADALAVDAAGTVYFSHSYERTVWRLAQAGIERLAGAPWQWETANTEPADGLPGGFWPIGGLAISPGGTLMVTQSAAVRTVGPDRSIATLAGNRFQGYADGKGVAASFTGASGMAYDAAGNLYVAETGNHAVRKMAPDGTVTTIAGGHTRGIIPGKLPGGLYQPRRLVVAGHRTLLVTSGSSVLRVVTP